jgi:multimeric flavodoxin WrbA
MDSGNTALILSPCLAGLREAGAEVELYHTIKLNIKPCTGEMNCWFKNTGRCCQNDDMNMLYAKFREADIWVFATPLYVSGVSGPMKCLFDRLVPLMEPFVEVKNQRCVHPLRKEVKRGKAVLVSSCAFWEKENFNQMIIHLEDVSRHMNRTFAGALLRPHAHVMMRLIKAGEPVADVFEAAKEAGRQIIRNGRFSRETLNIVSRELISMEDYVQTTNKMYRRIMEDHNCT